MPSLTKQRAKAIEASARGTTPMRVAASKSEGEWRIDLPGVRGLLTDDADREAVVWDMAPGGLELLARTLEWLLAQLPEELAFSAWWEHPPELDVLVSRAELLRIVRAGKIGTRTRYVVAAAE